MTCTDCGSLTINGARCYQCQLKVKAALFLSKTSPTAREIPGLKPANADAFSWLAEKCPSRVNPYSGHLEMEMPQTGRAFLELIAAAIEHGRGLGPRAEEKGKDAGQERFGMLELDDMEAQTT